MRREERYWNILFSILFHPSGLWVKKRKKGKEKKGGGRGERKDDLKIRRGE